MNINNIKKGVMFFLLTIYSSESFSQEQAKAAAQSSQLDSSLILAIVAMLLAIPIIILGRALVEVVRSKMLDNKKDTLPGVILVVTTLLGFGSSANAQQVKEKVVQKSSWLTSLTGTEWLLMITILIELIVIFYLSAKINSFIKPETVAVEKATSQWWETIKTKLSKTWGRMNNFRPISEEKDIDTGHSYDGIRELNNVTPAWFTTAFILSIIFSIVYLWRYHVSNSAPLQIEEYQISMAKAEKEQLEYLKNAADMVDETNIKMADAVGIGDGKLVYEKNCAVCHGVSGGGGAGPNLADEYWIHGGGLPDVFKSIKYGWQDKGMKAWKDELSAKQMAQIASYVKSIQGTKPAGGKAAEGELYKENMVGASVDTATKKAIDTAVKK